MTSKKVAESGWTIPDDWDGKTWRCVALQWPDSPKFDILLRGLLYSLTRGRDWDGFTGSVKTAQTYGWMIFDVNSPFVACADSDECPECPSPPSEGEGAGQPCGGGLVVLEDEDMGQVVTDVTIDENGDVKVWFGPCCSKTLTGIRISGIAPDIGPTPWLPDGGEEPAYSACGKADAIVNAIYTVLEATQDALVMVDYPWQILGHVEQHVGYNLDNKWLALLWSSWLALAGLSAIDMFSGLDLSDFIGFAPADVFSPVDQQVARCSLEGFFSADAAGIPDAETYDAMKSVIQGRNFLYQALINMAISTLGRSNLDVIARIGAANTNAVCVCPSVGSELYDVTQNWSSCDWVHWYDFTLADMPEWFVDQQNLHYWMPGEGLCYDPNISGNVDIRVQIPVSDNGGTLTHVYFYYNVRCCDDYGGGTDIKTPDHMLVDFPGTGWFDSQPSMGGNITVHNGALSQLLQTTVDENVGFGIEYHQPPPWDAGPANAVRVMAIAIGGTGSDPFAGQS
jgi:hypothetical protein